MPGRETWRLRARTLRAMVLLCAAQLMVMLVPFRYWRGTLGRLGPVGGLEVSGNRQEAGSAGAARRLAVHVERGAARLPFATKCLPRAMVLCWLLRRAGVAYVFKIAARPAALRQADRQAGLPPHVPARDDTLHAWVESGNTTVIGALPGPWLVVLCLSG